MLPPEKVSPSTVAKPVTTTRELLGAYLKFTPRPREVASFEHDMRTLNPTLLSDSINEAIAIGRIGDGTHAEQRDIIHSIYIRKTKELASLYPIVFSVESGLRSALSNFLATHFETDQWWVRIRNGVRKGHKYNDKYVIHPARQPAVDFVKQIFFTMEVIQSGPKWSKISGDDLTDEFYYCLTLSDLARIMTSDWLLCSGIFAIPLDQGKKSHAKTFKNHMKLITDARNELFHSNPIKNRAAVQHACEAILDALNFYLGDFDERVGESKYMRIKPTVSRSDRHLIPQAMPVKPTGSLDTAPT